MRSYQLNGNFFFFHLVFLVALDLDFPTSRKLVLIHEVGITERVDDEFVKVKMERFLGSLRKRGREKKKKKSPPEKINTIIKL